MVERVIKANIREKTGSEAAERERKKGLIPAILYGHKKENILLSLPRGELEAFLSHGQRTLDLEYRGGYEKALIKEIQYDALGTEVIHVDLARVALDERVTVSVEIELTGEPAGATEGGVLEQSLHELEVECLASDIPQRLMMKVDELNIGDAILVKNLKLPPGVKALLDGETAVAFLRSPAALVEEEVPAEEVPGEPEGKEETL